LLVLRALQRLSLALFFAERRYVVSELGIQVLAQLS
jgi:hypothetical protein